MVNNYFLNCNFDDLGIVSEGCGSCLRSQSVRGGEGGAGLGWEWEGKERTQEPRPGTTRHSSNFQYPLEGQSRTFCNVYTSDPAFFVNGENRGDMRIKGVLEDY